MCYPRTSPSNMNLSFFRDFFKVGLARHPKYATFARRFSWGTVHEYSCRRNTVVTRCVALTGRNCTGPPLGEYAIPLQFQLRRQTPEIIAIVWPPYTMCRRASNNALTAHRKTRIPVREKGRHFKNTGQNSCLNLMMFTLACSLSRD